jgi:excisionase family DNA binding protein
MEVMNVSIVEAARLLGVGRSTVYKYIAEGKLKKLKHYRRSLIPLANVLSLNEEVSHDA